ncbi:MAG: macrolide 2'-phosphotransferase [Microbacteriaceae bacterium]|nr:macrolide 2'-phosphotransferase [Microbacteriaceae bacterium]
MGVQFLELAGIATVAVPGLDVVGASEWTFDATGDYDSALLRTGDGLTAIARRPRGEAAVQEQLAQRRALAAISAGVRSRLPFAVPTPLGSFTGRQQQLDVLAFIPGRTCDRVELPHDSLLVAEIGRAIGAIHALPKSFVVEAGLPVLGAEEAREATAALIDRAVATERLPQALAQRWRAAVDDDSMWGFVPSVIHGSLERGSFVTNGAGVVGVLGWSDLGIGDPAQDMRWVQTLDGAVQRAVLDEYADARGASVDRQLRQRSVLYAELELARWLLHGAESGDETVIADAEQLLDGLLTRVRQLGAAELRHETLPVLDVIEVQELLAEAGTKARHHEANLPRRSAAGETGEVDVDLDDAVPAAPGPGTAGAEAPRRDASGPDASGPDAPR